MEFKAATFFWCLISMDHIGMAVFQIDAVIIWWIDDNPLRCKFELKYEYSLLIVCENKHTDHGKQQRKSETYSGTGRLQCNFLILVNSNN